MIALGSIETQSFCLYAGQGEIGAVTDHYFQQIKPLLQKYIVDQKHSSFPE